MKEEDILALKSISDEDKQNWIKNMRERSALKFDDFKGRWYVPCCEEDLFQINTEDDWDFAYNFDPNWTKFVTYETREDALADITEHSDVNGYDVSGNKVRLE